MKLRREAASKRVARGETSGPNENTIRASEMRQTERARMPANRRQGCLRSIFLELLPKHRVSNCRGDRLRMYTFAGNVA